MSTGNPGPDAHRAPQMRPAMPSKPEPRERPKPRIEPPGTMPVVGDRIVKVKRCVAPLSCSATIGTRADVVRIVLRGPNEGVWTDVAVVDRRGGVHIVSPCLCEFEKRGGWRVCKRRRGKWSR
jgi:hypothetical protein